MQKSKRETHRHTHTHTHTHIRTPSADTNPEDLDGVVTVRRVASLVRALAQNGPAHPGGVEAISQVCTRVLHGIGSRYAVSVAEN